MINSGSPPSASAHCFEGEYSSILTSQFVFPALSNHLIRSRQDIRWNRQADLLGRLEVDDETELLRLFHGEISGLCALRMLSNGGTPKQVAQAHAVAHKAPVFDSFRIIVGRPEPAF